MRELSQLKKILVTGGRSFGTARAERRYIMDSLTYVHGKLGDFILIQGGCPTGADHCAKDWARLNEIICINHPAQWKKDSKKAGPIRNSEMLQWEVDGVIQFPGYKGTMDMLRKARKAGLGEFIMTFDFEVNA